MDDGDDPGLPLQSLDFVQAYIPTVEQARDAIIQEMESMVVNGLAELVRLTAIVLNPRLRADRQNQTLLSSSLQTAHNLQLLPELVSNLLADLNDAVTLRITKAFDSTAIGKEVAGKGRLSLSFAPQPIAHQQIPPPQLSSSRLGAVSPLSLLPRTKINGSMCCGRD